MSSQKSDQICDILSFRIYEIPWKSWFLSPRPSNQASSLFCPRIQIQRKPFQSDSRFLSNRIFTEKMMRQKFRNILLWKEKDKEKCLLRVPLSFPKLTKGSSLGQRQPIEIRWEIVWEKDRILEKTQSEENSAREPGLVMCFR